MRNKLPLSDYEVLPDQKKSEIERLQKAGRVLAMAGDGITTLRRSSRRTSRSKRLMSRS